MTNKENTLRIIRFDRPKQVLGSVPCYGLSYLGCDHQGYAGGGHHQPAGSKWRDIWSTEWHKEYPDVMGFPKGNPLSDPSFLSDYLWPDPKDDRICGQIYQQYADFPGGDLFLCGSHRDTLWEKSYMLVGMETMMMYFYTEPKYAKEILRHIMDFQLGIAKHYAACGIEIANMGDDLGTQNSLILSPQILKEFLYPEYKRLFSFYREKGILISFHSCGQIEPVLEMFMTLGVDILNPVQATANNLESVRKVTQGRMALAGGISTDILITGPVSRIQEEVRDKIHLLGKEGGYFCSPDQSMPFPAEHVRAYREALAVYGNYPIE